MTEHARVADAAASLGVPPRTLEARDPAAAGVAVSAWALDGRRAD